MDLIFGVALSIHLGFEGSYNILHPNVRFEYDNYIAGAYYNSEYAISAYVGREVVIGEHSSVEIGVVNGYTDLPVSPFVKYNYKNFYIAPGFEYGETKGLVTGYQFNF